ncbi:hypothetical protein ACEPPN_006338 [Leptodophora sp. 'Broadleaf-Isolate-01']
MVERVTSNDEVAGLAFPNAPHGIPSTSTRPWLQNRPEVVRAVAHYIPTYPKAEEIPGLPLDLVAQSPLDPLAGAHVAMADTEVKVAVSVVAEVQVQSEAQRSCKNGGLPSYFKANYLVNTNRGTAYILYTSETDAEAAIAHMHESQIDGAVINVSIVLPRRKFSPSPPLARRGLNLDPRASFNAAPNPDVDPHCHPTVAELRETPTHTGQDLAHDLDPQDATVLDLDPLHHAHGLPQEEDEEAVEVVDEEQAQREMVVGGGEAQVIAATAVMRTEAEAEVGDVEDVADVKCTTN